MDAGDYRAASLEQWERAAPGWGARAERLERMVAPVSRWLLDAARLQPGHVVLELAAGPGEVGFLAAELIAPGGRLICSDFAEPMLEVARERARELGIEDRVELRRLDAESLDLDTAAVDAVLCRWGYMLVADPEAALRETRRVLRPGGRVALAAWGPAEDNPWAAVADELAREALELPPRPRDQPGMFAFAADGHVERLLDATGFLDVEVEKLDLRFAYESFDEWWEVSQGLTRSLADAADALEPPARARLRADLERALRERSLPGEGLVLPARALVAAASA